MLWIIGEQFEEASALLVRANQQQVNSHKLTLFEKKLSAERGFVNDSSSRPAKDQVDNLVEHFKKERFNDAESLALSLTKEFPNHSTAWKILGTLLYNEERYTEAVVANRVVVKLNPQDARAHFFLGNTLKELGALGDALKCYGRAISLNADFAEAHVSAGVTLEYGKA